MLPLLHRFMRAGLFLWLGLGLMVSAWRTEALELDPPENFFTNVAARLMRQQLGKEWTQIQIAPTNQYDRAVHRLFQVTANLYDATTTNIYPSVFRPLLATNQGAVWLAGFTNDHRVSTLHGWLDANVFGLPLVIGAKKGFPNFNEFTLRSDVLVTRKLELQRPATNAPVNQTNQMYLLSISNCFAVEAWNSYDVDYGAAPYPRDLQIVVTNLARCSMTNTLGVQTSGVQTAAASLVIPAGSWSGGLYGTNAYRLPMNTSQTFLSNAVYVFNNNTFANLGANQFEDLANQFPIPQCVLTVSNRLMYWMEEPGLDRLIDFVLLEDRHSVDLHRHLLTANHYLNLGYNGPVIGVWQTNRTSPNAPPAGIVRQIDISRGQPATTLADWREFSQEAANITQNEKTAAITTFQNFLSVANTNNLLALQAPFSPSARLAALTTWQANDPLVHYRPEDLRFSPVPTNAYFRPTSPVSNVPPSTLGRFNVRYTPWGGHPDSPSYGMDSTRSTTDAGVYSSVFWNFPTNKTLGTDWLGRVHRGTPWQTIYLQADVASISGWFWAGNDLRTHPTNDWQLAALWAALVNTNHPRDLISVNDTNLAHWQTTLAGLTVLSNNLDFAVLLDPPQFESIVITSNAPQITTVVSAMQAWRDAQRKNRFADVATWLRTPELSSASPWLNLDSWGQLIAGLTDEAYEALPAQLLARVRSDPVGHVTSVSNQLHVTFTAFDGWAWRVESSTNLTDWTTFSAPHFSTNGTFTITVPPTDAARHFRTVLQ